MYKCGKLTATSEKLYYCRDDDDDINISNSRYNNKLTINNNTAIDDCCEGKVVYLVTDTPDFRFPRQQFTVHHIMSLFLEHDDK